MYELALAVKHFQIYKCVWSTHQVAVEEAKPRRREYILLKDRGELSAIADLAEVPGW